MLAKISGLVVSLGFAPVSLSDSDLDERGGAQQWEIESERGVGTSPHPVASPGLKAFVPVNILTSATVREYTAIYVALSVKVYGLGG